MCWIRRRHQSQRPRPNNPTDFCFSGGNSETCRAVPGRGSPLCSVTALLPLCCCYSVMSRWLDPERLLLSTLEGQCWLQGPGVNHEHTNVSNKHSVALKYTGGQHVQLLSVCCQLFKFKLKCLLVGSTRRSRRWLSSSLSGPIKSLNPNPNPNTNSK